MADEIDKKVAAILTRAKIAATHEHSADRTAAEFRKMLQTLEQRKERRLQSSAAAPATQAAAGDAEPSPKGAGKPKRGMKLFRRLRDRGAHPPTG